MCVSHLCSSPAHWLVFVTPKSQITWLIGGLSKNAVHHVDQLEKATIFVISNYFEQFLIGPKTCKTFSLIFKTIESLKSLRMVSQFLPINRVSGKKVTYQDDCIDKTKILYISEILFSIFCHTAC